MEEIYYRILEDYVFCVKDFYFDKKTMLGFTPDQPVPVYWTVDLWSYIMLVDRNSHTKHKVVNELSKSSHY